MIGLVLLFLVLLFLVVIAAVFAYCCCCLHSLSACQSVASQSLQSWAGELADAIAAAAAAC